MSVQTAPEETITTADLTVDQAPTKSTQKNWFAHTPTNAFTIVLGLGGLGLAWKNSGLGPGIENSVGFGLLILAGATYVITLFSYIAKIIFYRSAAIEDFNDADASNYLPAISMGPMILAAGVLYVSQSIAEIMWLCGAVLHLFLALRQIRRWIIRNFEIKTTSPAWFIPISGSLLAAISGYQFGYVELSWSLFALGLGFWISLFVIVLNRIIFHDKLPAKYIPTLFLLMAPPSLAFMSYTRLNDGVMDNFSQFLYHFALIASLLVLSMFKLFQRLPFNLSWWAYTFPMAAVTLASFEYAKAQSSEFIGVVALALLSLTSALVALVFVKTLVALRQKNLVTTESHATSN